MIAYRVLRSLLRVTTAVFFRQIEVVGLEHVPARQDGRVLFVGNHPNALIDPVLTGAMIRTFLKSLTLGVALAREEEDRCAPD